VNLGTSCRLLGSMPGGYSAGVCAGCVHVLAALQDALGLQSAMCNFHPLCITSWWMMRNHLVSLQ
jgi:hypothetical protein